MATSGRTARPRVAVAKFASCDGCQLTLLDLEDELLEIVSRFDIVEFPEATSRRSPGPYDIVFVEGSISAPEHIDQIKELRKQARILVTIGACATAGGIQALRNWADHDAYRAAVYAHPEWIESLAKATPIAEHVKVDGELRGCPIDPGQLTELLTAVLVGSPAPDPRRGRLPRMQAEGDRLPRRRARRGLHGSGDHIRLQRPLPHVRPRLLRLLWAARQRQRQELEHRPAQVWPTAGGGPTSLRRLHRLRRAVPIGYHGAGQSQGLATQRGLVFM